jgi:hypothetical protein
MPEHPTREQAVTALTKLTDLLAEFPFIGPIDRASAALSTPPPPSAVFPAAAASAEPAAAPATPQDTIAKTGFDAQGNPAATPGQKKPFLLDRLLR